ncbi:MAG: hypothetical protein AB7U63_17270 [Porticoccaceae bacterium]
MNEISILTNGVERCRKRLWNVRKLPAEVVKGGAKVKKRKDGRYASNIYIGLEDGRRKYHTVYAKTQAELKQKVAELKLKLGKNGNKKRRFTFLGKTPRQARLYPLKRLLKGWPAVFYFLSLM